jgi:hypothetical protein
MTEAGLDGDEAIELRIAGAEHLTHAAGARDVLDLVRAEASARSPAPPRRFYAEPNVRARAGPQADCRGSEEPARRA